MLFEPERFIAVASIRARSLSEGDVRLSASVSRLTSDGLTVTVPAGADVDTWRIVSREPATGMVGMHIEQREDDSTSSGSSLECTRWPQACTEARRSLPSRGSAGSELSESEGRALIRGAPGTGVTLEIAPASGGAARTVVIVRVEAKDED